MRNSAIVVGMIVGLAFLPAGPGAYGMQFVGDNVGLISATVAKADNERGLTVRTAPSAESQAQAFVPVGTKIRGYAMFRNGYVKIEAPSKGGWVRLDHLQPVGGSATVSTVDRPDLCLRIRSGPGTSFDKVGCAELGQKLELTGLWSQTNWAQISAPVSGWVAASQIASDLRPAATVRETQAPEESISSTMLPTPERTRRHHFSEPYDYRWRGPAGYGYGYPYGGVGVHINIGGKKKK